MLAVHGRRRALARLLIEAGADIHAKSTLGESVETVAEKVGMKNIREIKARVRP
jgi:hypothetical protein